MSLQVSQQTEARIIQEAERQGLSVDTLLERLIERAVGGERPDPPAPELPVLHLGPMGPLHRRDIYDRNHAREPRPENLHLQHGRF